MVMNAIQIPPLSPSLPTTGTGSAIALPEALASGTGDDYSDLVPAFETEPSCPNAARFGESSPISAASSTSSSGEGGSVGGIGSPPPAGGDGRSGGKGRGIDALDVEGWLKALSESKKFAIEWNDAESLQQWGLVDLYDETRYSELRREAEKSVELSKKVARLRAAMDKREKRRRFLAEKTHSKWHSLVSSSNTLNREREEASALDSSIELVKSILDGFERSSEQASSSAEELAGVVPVTLLNPRRESAIGASGDPYRSPPHAEGGMRLTENGRARLRMLEAGEKRLAGVRYQDFARDLDLLDTIVNERYEGWNDVYNSLLEDGWHVEPRCRDFALAISVMDGDLQDNYRRAFSVNDWMHRGGWKDHDRLIIASELAVQKCAIEELQDSLDQLYRLMILEHHSSGYATWREAAAILGIAGKSSQEKYDRFYAIFDALSMQGWGRFAHATSMIAANLAQSPGAKEEIVEGFNNLETAMGAAGYYRSAGMGLAAAILYTAPGSAEAKVARFAEASEVMRGYGWQQSEDYYPSAAILSLMPGAVQENSLLLKRLYGRMSKDGQKNNLIARGLRIMGAAYNDLVSTGGASSFAFASASYGDGEPPLSPRWSGWRLQPWQARSSYGALRTRREESIWDYI